MARILHPNYYTIGRIEVKDFIRDKDMNFNLGNVIKYVCRAGHKADNTLIDDLVKARNYIDYEIDYQKKSLVSHTEAPQRTRIIREYKLMDGTKKSITEHFEGK